MPKMPGGDEKKEESAESKEEAAEQVRIYVQGRSESVLGCRVGQSWQVILCLRMQTADCVGSS